METLKDVYKVTTLVREQYRCNNISEEEHKAYMVKLHDRMMELKQQSKEA